MRVRRALLFMPGADRRKIEKGAALGVDSVIMDLEDGVALNNKPAARATVAAALREVDFGQTERLVRVNPVGSRFHEDDLAATIDAHPDGYVLPKVESANALRAIDDWLSAAERERGWPESGIALLAIVETALGVVNLRERLGRGYGRGAHPRRLGRLLRPQRRRLARQSLRPSGHRHAIRPP